MSPRRLRAITPIAVARTRVIRGGGEKTTNLGHGLEGGGGNRLFSADICCARQYRYCTR